MIVYINDILIYYKDKDKHLKLLKEVLRRLREHHLFVKLSKCKFFKKEVNFIGHVISGGYI